MQEMNNKILTFLILFLSVLFVIVFFLWQGNVGFSLWDEGYLWYGAQRVLLGEVPLLDFKAYDPGRYYWAAAFMHLFGDNGIMALRVSVAIFQAIGLFVGLFLICSSAKQQNIFYILLSAIILMLWMYPRHKLFDISLSLLLMGVMTFLIQNPTARRYFIAGLIVGLAAVFGKNHGLYGIIGSLATMVWLSIKPNPSHTIGSARGFFLWSAGVIAGFMPVIIMALVIPGFAEALFQDIYFLYERNFMTLPMPIPWPWLADFLPGAYAEGIRQVLIGLFFVAAVAFAVLFIIWVFYQKIRGKQTPPAIIAAAFLMLPYAHHAYSSSDVSHLAQGIFPLLIGFLALFYSLPSKIKWPLSLTLCLASLLIMLPQHPGWQCRGSSRCVNVEISQDNLKVRQGTARDIALLRHLARQYASQEETFIAVPVWPGAYALLERKSPMWEIFPLHPQSKAFEEAEIERIKQTRPAFAVIIDFPLRGRDELRYKNTHPLTNKFIQDNFERLPYPPRPEYQIYKAKWISG